MIFEAADSPDFRDENLEITLEFYEKPSKREYPDYYQTISHPTALKDIQKSASNNKFPDWESFITEAEYLWSNALTYNEEGSFINNNANKLKVSLILRAIPCFLHAAADLSGLVH